MARIAQDPSRDDAPVCSDDEAQEASALSVQLAIPPYVLSGLSLRLVCAVLERCQIFIGNDTGTAHLAAAMDCPTVVVSRHPMTGDPHHPNSPTRFAPRSRRMSVVQPEYGAGECISHCRLPEPHCILQVASEQVVAAAKEVLPQALWEPELSRAEVRRHVLANSDAGYPVVAGMA